MLHILSNVKVSHGFSFFSELLMLSKRSHVLLKYKKLATRKMTQWAPTALFAQKELKIKWAPTALFAQKELEIMKLVDKLLRQLRKLLGKQDQILQHFMNIFCEAFPNELSGQR